MKKWSETSNGKFKYNYFDLKYCVVMNNVSSYYLKSDCTFNNNYV